MTGSDGMRRGVQWVRGGRIQPPLTVQPGPAEERQLLQRQGAVKITEDESGTTLRWSMFSANWASLYFVAEWVHGALGPITCSIIPPAGSTNATRMPMRPRTASST